MTPRIQIVRFHESGHALAAAYGGLDVLAVTAVPSGRLDGTAQVRIPSGRDETPATQWADLVMTLAGAEAVRAIVLRGASSINEGNGGDHDIVVRLAESMSSEDRSAVEILRDAHAEAQEWARRCRPAIIALAGSLAAHNDRLEGRELTAAIAAAFEGRSWYRDDEARRRVAQEYAPRLPRPAAGLAGSASAPIGIPMVLAAQLARGWSSTRTATGYRCTRPSRGMAGLTGLERR